MPKINTRKRRSAILILVTACVSASCGGDSIDITCAEYFKAAMSTLQDQGNGVVHDTATDLHWYRCNAGQSFVDGECKDEALNLNFDATVVAVQDLTAAPISQTPDMSWRMPTQEEYATLTDVPCHSPMINVVAFPDAQSETFYWSSSEGKNDDFACGTRLKDGRQLCQISRSSVNPTMLVASVD